MAASPIVPTFNNGQPVLTAIDDSGTTLSHPSAVAAQADGKLVVVGTNQLPGSVGIFLTPTLYVARYNADGSPDATFGTNGRATITLPVTTGVTSNTPASVAAVNVVPAGDVLIQPDGKIVLNANIINQNLTNNASINPTLPTPVESIAIRLTATGAPDSTFGTGGQTVLTTDTPVYERLALQSDGKIVLAGTASVSDGSGGTTSNTAVTRLDADGTPDSSFHAGSPALLAANNDYFVGNPAVLALRVIGTGSIKVVARGGQYSTECIVSQLTSTGTLDPNFGTGGAIIGAYSSNLRAAGIAPDGRVVIALVPGDVTYESLIRLNADGSTDATYNATTGIYVTNVLVNSDGSVIVAGEINYVERFQADGTPDGRFGPAGTDTLTVPDLSAQFPGNGYPNSLQRNREIAAITTLANGQVAVVGFVHYYTYQPDSSGKVIDYGSQGVVGLFKATTPSIPGDYSGDGKSDLAAELTQLGQFAIRTAFGDSVQPFGIPGADQTISAPGDYDGDGRSDVAAYLPALGILAYRPSSGVGDVYIRFGPAGVGNAIPVPGDYDGDGKTDVAVFLPSSGTFAIDPSSGAVPYAVTFGPAGVGNAIPAPGDYDGDGKTDLALYLPNSGAFAIRPTGGGANYAVPFGMPGAGNTIPAPGDYDGDGKTDLAAYLPTLGFYAYRASSGTGDVLTHFGPAGRGAAIPVSGDYDGDGKADVALFLPGGAVYAIDPSGGGTPYAMQFGAAGAGNTLPATTVMTGQATVSAMRVAATLPDVADSVPVYLPSDLPEVVTTRKKSTT